MMGTNTTEHSKYYYEKDRNISPNDTLPQMKIAEDNRIPSYYIGKNHKYEARKVVEDFELSYNIGTAVTYLLRANKKHDTPHQDLKKAIAHLEFELEILKNEKTNL